MQCTRTAGLSLTDEQIVARVLAGERACFELIMRRHNQRLYRVARAIVRDDAEAEDVMQEAYVAAFTHLRAFGGRARFSTWLTRIAVHEALTRARRARRVTPRDDMESEVDAMKRDPEEEARGRELGKAVERAVDELPEPFRVVFVLRAIEELNVAETAECLEIPEETVKTRLFRARALLKDGLPRAYAFERPRCDRVVAAVLARIVAVT